MIASLPMYDRSDTAAVYDRLWHHMRAHLGYGPTHLTRGGDLWAEWQSPDLLFGQTCSLPYRIGLRDKLALVASPVHDLPVPKGHYCSHLVVRCDEPRDAIAAFSDAAVAVNGWESQSGWGCLPEVLARARPFVTGSHAGSAAAVADGRADIAAIDAVTWKLLCRSDAFAARLRVLETTPSSPALPFVTAKGQDVDAVFAALEAGFEALSRTERDTICVTGLVRLPEQDYLAVPMPIVARDGLPR